MVSQYYQEDNHGCQTLAPGEANSGRHWDDPPEPKGPALDFTRQALIKNAEPETGPESVARAAEALRELLGWPDWARALSVRRSRTVESSANWAP